jgi:hypothetical protein
MVVADIENIGTTTPRVLAGLALDDTEEELLLLAGVATKTVSDIVAWSII